MMPARLLLAATAAVAAASAPPPGRSPPPIYDMQRYTTPVEHVENGTRATVHVPGGTPFSVVHLWGDTHARGYAYGWLMADRIEKILVDLDVFYQSEVSSIPWAKLHLPAALQKALEGALKEAAPPVFKAALRWVYEQQKSYLAASPSQPITEIKAMAQGVCARRGQGGAACSASELETELNTVNELPELIRMTCSMFGAWGSATPAGTLVQLRTLDFGGGPFVNHTVLTVHHHPPGQGHTFAQVSFSGFVGAITGFSDHVALSEKVWETYDTIDVQPGTYQGIPVVGVIRNMLQFASSKDDAVAMADAAQRTWAVFLGVGDFATQRFDALGYREKSVQVSQCHVRCCLPACLPAYHRLLLKRWRDVTHCRCSMPTTAPR
jgi:isopenicillin-N N-acyltransferase-like protein